MDAALGTSSIPVTSVWTAGFAHAGTGVNPTFSEVTNQAKVRSFVQEAYIQIFKFQDFKFRICEFSNYTAQLQFWSTEKT